MPIPRATYRVQLHAGFTFDDAAAIVPYLARLGISDLYVSPILQAAPGSTHGYDVVDHHRLNDELGGTSAFERLTHELAAHDMRLVVDVVPNHMALAGETNRWWWDVLEDGPASRYAEHFDIDWSPGPGGAGPTVLMPVLGDHYGRVLEAGELHLAREGGAFLVRYHEHALPLSPRSIGELVAAAAERCDSDELRDIAEGLHALPLASATDRASRAARHNGKVTLRQRIRTVTAAEHDVAGALDAELADVSHDVDALDALLARQNYRLAHWRVASDELDYRRFFDITTLIGLRAEDPHVFDETHRLLLDLVAAGDVAGLRIDHVDGLRDPAGYLDRLRVEAPDAWIVVEKILALDERLPESWPVAGTTGYDFMAAAGRLFVDGGGFAELVEHFHRWVGTDEPFDAAAYAGKGAVMDRELAAEVERVTQLLAAVCTNRRRHRDHTRRALRDVVVELAAALNVYRTYCSEDTPASPADRERIDLAISAIAGRRPDIDRELLDLVERALTLDERDALTVEFALRFQQLSAPVMAKGVEDTALYRWAPLLALNEVGSDPGAAADAAAGFHERNRAIAHHWPTTMLALSTHDTKRSADVRARLCVLTEIAGAWTTAVDAWREHNGRHRDSWDDPIIELHLYQQLVGAWPIEPDRLEGALVKAANEAKLRVSWRDPDPDYEAGLRRFVQRVTADTQFLAGVEQFLREHEVIARGRVLSLAQLTLELTSPGVPDTYQGDERWKLDLVDPDNRRPVDFERAAKLLDAIGDAPATEVPLAEDDDGAVKLWLLHRLLRHRRDAPARYSSERYEPLALEGGGADRFVGFVRDGLLTVVPRHSKLLAVDERTTALLPDGEWRSVFDGTTHRGPTSVTDLLRPLPVAVLERAGG